MIKIFSEFLLTTILSFVVMVGALLIWVAIQANHITDPSLADRLGFAIAYGGIAAIPILLVLGVSGGYYRLFKKLNFKNTFLLSRETLQNESN
ncbi:hypothetical protein P4658_27280 [Priestia megaterium]|uniref:hypothetical protein n=1 Tax=Priestia megaterium TaxID=1404 RepID=UPI002E1DB91D|nr:hypothetical protein [Priestia megaterium]